METDQGILASGKDELYGAIFGRDSLITSLKLLKVYQQTENQDLLRIVRKVLLTLAQLQGKEVNIESGEEPGKCIHEYRPDHHEHLTEQRNKPWYLYPDKIMRNYDTVDATPLYLIAVYRYLQQSHDNDFLDQVGQSVELSLKWIFDFADSNKDGFIDYSINSQRHSGGLVNQNWMDSTEAIFHEDGSLVAAPIAPVEAQAYVYLALRLWQKHFADTDKEKSGQFFSRAYQLKKQFNRTFILDDDGLYLASALDGTGKPIKAVRSSMGHGLWAALTVDEDGEQDCIVESEFIPAIVRRMFENDLYQKGVGIRTLSKKSTAFSANSYHNGSIWPHDNSMIADGLENFGYLAQAQELRDAILAAASYFQTPIELFVYDENYSFYLSPTGQEACKNQAWSAAALLRAANASAGRKSPLRFLSVELKAKRLYENWVKKLSLSHRLEIASLLSLKDKIFFLERPQKR